MNSFKPGEKYAQEQATKQAVLNMYADVLEFWSPFRFIPTSEKTICSKAIATQTSLPTKRKRTKK
jgi:hypothetical protein